ncbi:MAG: sigma-70 family RNA polymerase sigma factor [Lachnospiraceae bacterium]|nr:sigma-70 family RNA polymerase sigma factor [Lachnospiraceae bacterium]
MEDEEIIELFNARSEQAIAELSEKYGPFCRKIAGNILGNSRDAEECVNDAYLGVWKRIPPENPKPLSAYLFKIVRNLSIARYHANTAKKRNSFYDVALEELEGCLESSATVEEEISVRELSRLLDLFLKRESRENRIMFVRRYWYSDSVLEIAGKFGISENNASVRLSRIRNRLRKFLQKEGYII